MSDKFRRVPPEKAHELLAELNSALTELERIPDDQKTIECIFHALHNLNGSGAMSGFEETSDFTLEIETVFDLVRHGEMTVTKDLIDITLSVCGHISIILDEPDPACKRYAGDLIPNIKGKFLICSSS